MLRRSLFPVLSSGLVATAVLASAPATAAACMCRTMSPAEYSRWVMVLVEGEIVSTRMKDGRQDTVIRISRVHKGDARITGAPGQTVTVTTLPEVGTCGYRFPASGKVTVAMRSAKGGYWTEMCTMQQLKAPNAQTYIDAIKATAPK